MCLASVARAETEAIRVEYHGVTGCPSEAAFLEQVFRRTSSARLVPESQSARTFVVSIDRDATGLVGSLVIRETNGTTLARTVRGAACEDVAGVLALATALAIDPNAALAPAETLAAAEPSGSAPEPTPEPGPTDEAPPERFGKTPVPSESSNGPTWSGALGPSLAALVAPHWSVGGTLSFRAMRGQHSPLASYGVNLTVVKALESGDGSPSASYAFFWARPDACLPGLTLEQRLALMPCVGLEVGAVNARGSNIAIGESRTRFWATADWIARLRVAPGDAWFVEIDAALVLPITRYSFVFRDPDTPIHTVPALASVLGARLGLVL